MNILVLDDNPIRPKVFIDKSVLEKYNLNKDMVFHVFPCTQQAYKWLEEGNDFDLILLDYRVPHDPDGRPEPDVSRRFAENVLRDNWKNDHQLLIILMTEDYDTRAVRNFAGDYAWDPEIHLHLFPYNGREGDKWLSYLRKGIALLDDIRKGPPAPGKDPDHDLRQIQRVFDELYEVWDDDEADRERIVGRVGELKNHYLGNDEACETLAGTGGQTFGQWAEQWKPYIEQIEKKICQQRGFRF